MKRIAVFMSILCLMFVFCSCSDKDISDTNTSDTNTQNTDDTSEPSTDSEELGEIEPLIAAESFGSFEEFEQHEREIGANGNSCYYVPSSLPSDCELKQITKRDGVYVMVEYTLSSPDASDSSLGDYDAERLRTLICQYSPDPDGQKALESNFISNGYEAVEFEGRTYYRWDEHAENDPEKRAIGYEVAFLDEGHLIFMHLPAVDTFENMMKYADVVKVTVG